MPSHGHNYHSWPTNVNQHRLSTKVKFKALIHPSIHPFNKSPNALHIVPLVECWPLPQQEGGGVDLFFLYQEMWRMSSLSHRNHLRPSLWTVSQGTEGCRDAKTFKTILLGWTFILLDKFRRRAGHHYLYIFAVRCYIVSSLKDVKFSFNSSTKGVH